MSKGLENVLSQFFPRVPGLLSVTVADRDGVTVTQAVAPGAGANAVLSQTQMACATSAIEQGTKLGMGGCPVSLVTYGDLQAVHLDRDPLVVHLVADKSVQPGFLMDLKGEVLRTIEPLRAGFPKPDSGFA